MRKLWGIKVGYDFSQHTQNMWCSNDLIKMKLINHRNKTNRTVVLSHIALPTILIQGPQHEKFQQSGKQDSFKCILKRYASSSSQFFMSTTVIQSGPDNFEESILAMTF